jgi:hypothetical protein
LAVLKLAVMVSGVLALAKLGFLDFITGGFDTGRLGGLPSLYTDVIAGEGDDDDDEFERHAREFIADVYVDHHIESLQVCHCAAHTV